jgi:hypothetical protein
VLAIDQALLVAEASSQSEQEAEEGEIVIVEAMMQG